MKKSYFKSSKFYICFLLLICTVLIFLIIDKNIDSSLKIYLNGDSNITLNYGEEYEELGASAKYNSKDITDKIRIDSNLNISKLGKYTIKYIIKYKNKIKKVERTIEIVDTEKPSFELDDKLTILVGNEISDYSVKAIDNYDGDISEKIEIEKESLNINEPGEYELIYKVKDLSGNENIASQTVIVTNSFATEIPVLNYHFFYKDWNENCHEALCENVATFRKQLDYLKENNYHTLTIQEFKKWMYGEIELPEKSILITVDDGAHGTSKINGNHLIPILEEYKMHATLFLITGWWDIENYRSDYLDIQSHTNDLHYEANCGYRSKVNCVSYDDLLDDLKKSIDVVKDTTSFCFPFYDYTQKSIDAVKEVGFKIAFIGGRRKAKRSDDKYKIPRYPVYDSTSMNSFINMVS